MTNQHSSLMGGSTAAQRMHCPGSYKLELDCPEEEESEFAAVGTALHMAMELYYSKMWDGDAPLEGLLGEWFYKTEITPELLETKIRPAHTAIEQLFIRSRGFADYELEARVQPKFDDRVHGTIDFLARGVDEKVYIIDFKFGDGIPVSPVGNEQLLFYAACACYDEEYTDLVGDATEFTLAIIQPREGGDTLQTYDVTRDDLERFVDMVVDTIEKAERHDAPLKAGSHCRWCSAKPMCPEMQRQVIDVESVPATHLPPVELARWMKQAEVVELWIAALRKHVNHELGRGVKIPGYKLVEKRPQRTYSDPEKVERTLRRYLGARGAFEKKMISPAKAEKALGKKKYARILEKYVSWVSSGTTVAVDTDKRPDVGSQVTQLWETLKRIGIEHE